MFPSNQVFSFAFASLILFGVQCGVGRNNLSIGSANQDIVATIVKNEIHPFKTKFVSIPNGKKTEGVNFVDAKNGFLFADVGGKRVLLNTSDGGVTWLTKNLLNDVGYVSNAAFFSRLDGVILASTTPSENSRMAKHIMLTHDAGMSWRTVYSSPENSSLVGLFFLNIETGIVFGRHEIAGSQNAFQHFVIVTIDGGKTWIDKSDELNRLAKAQRTDGLVMDHLIEFIASSDKTNLIVISKDGRLFRTGNLAESWTLISTIPGGLFQTPIRSLNKAADDSYAAVGGQSGVEGTWGLFALSEADIWSKRRLGGFNFADSICISKDEFLVVGSAPADKSDDERKGVVLHSGDRGFTWSVVVESENSMGFDSVTRISDGKYFVSGEGSQAILLER